MGDLHVNNVSDEVITALEQRAARNQRTPEDEHRLILQLVLTPSTNFKTLADALRDYFQAARTLRR